MPLDAFYDGQQMRDGMADLLRRGEARIQRGWCQGSFWRFDDDFFRLFCAWGAVRLEHSAFEEAAVDALYSALPLEWQVIAETEGDCLALYNNECGRTKAEILTLFGTAIAAALLSSASRDAFSSHSLAIA